MSALDWLPRRRQTAGRAARADRVAGALLGVHAGDSLGATSEFKSTPTVPPVRDIVGGGAFNWDPGDPTDDTDMTAAVLRAFLRPDVRNGDTPVEQAAADGFVDWYDRGPRDIGGTTATALRSVKAGKSLNQTGATHPYSAANGALMRTIPTALDPDPDRRRRATAAITRITHALPVCVDASVWYSDCVAELIEHGNFDAAFEHTQRNSPVSDDVRDYVQGIYDAGPDTPPPVVGGQKQGWVLGSLGCAVWAGMQPDAEAALIRLTSEGWDADTNGAIAGGLLYARDGATAIPDRWRDRLKLGDEFTAAAQTLAADLERDRSRFARDARRNRREPTGSDATYVASVSGRRCGAPRRTGGECRVRLVAGRCPHHGTTVHTTATAGPRGGAAATADPMD